MRQQTFLVACVGSIAMLAGFVWAVLPLRADPISKEIPSAAVVREPSAQLEEDVDVSAFDIRLWHQIEEPKPEHRTVEEVESSKIETINLTLLGILNGESARKAILYDPEEDRLFVAEVGERVGDVELKAIERDAVTLALGSSTRDLRIGRAR